MKYRYQIMLPFENAKSNMDWEELTKEKKQQFGRLLEEDAMNAAGYYKIIFPKMNE